MNETGSIEAVRKRAEAGDAEAQNDLGRHLAQGGSSTEAEQWFRRAAEQGLAKAKHNFGVLYLGKKEARTAATWFGQATKDGWLPSAFALGEICRATGQEDRAIIILQFAAERGHAEAQDALGRIYFDRDTEADNPNARYWSELAATQGIPDAKLRMGLIFHEGRGTPRDPERAAAYFLEAANLGHPGAQVMIGVCLHMGIGAPADRIEAAHWLLRSAAQGNEGAKGYLEARAGMADLSQQELEEAKRRARAPLPWTGLPVA